MSERVHPFVGISQAAVGDALGWFLRYGGKEPPSTVMAARLMQFDRQGWFAAPEERRFFEWVFRDVWEDAYVARATNNHPTEGQL